VEVAELPPLVMGVTTLPAPPQAVASVRGRSGAGAGEGANRRDGGNGRGVERAGGRLALHRAAAARL